MVQPWVKEDYSIEHTSLFEVITQLSTLMSNREMLMQQEVEEEKKMGDEEIEQRLFELKVNTLLIDAVLEDACSWVSMP